MTTTTLIFSTILLLALSTEGCSKGPKLKGVKATQTMVETTVSTTSSGTVDAEQQAVLGFSTTGRIAKINVRLGSAARKGQVLAELENIDLRSILDDSENELKRSRELFANGLVSKAALDTAKKNNDIARANLDRTLLRAPFDGVVTEMNLELGELAQSTVSPTKALLRLIDMKPRIIKGEIDEVDLAKVKVGDPARVKIQAARPQPFSAKIRRVVPFVSTTKEQDRTSQIELQMAETESLIPVGASADVEIITHTKPEALAVPTRAILGTGGQKYLYRFDGKKIHKTVIKLGVGNYERTEILSGVTNGEVVVYPSDDFELKDDMRVQVELLPWP
ncbi:efflux RND transporter periplasmic adaptor subunit [Bdellovibrionota bacterium FG-1]